MSRKHLLVPWRLAGAHKRLLALVAVALLVAASSGGRASAQSMNMDGMDRTGTVRIENDHERELFARLLCTCGGCQREAISTCACSMAEDRRDMVRAWLKKGMSDAEVQAKYVKEFGEVAMSVPPNEGKARAVYLVPLAVIFMMAIFMIRTLRRFARKGDEQAATAAAVAKAHPKTADDEKRDAYDDKLDDELRDLDR